VGEGLMRDRRSAMKAMAGFPWTLRLDG